jgi:hypothetical protein
VNAGLLRLPWNLADAGLKATLQILILARHPEVGRYSASSFS